MNLTEMAKPIDNDIRELAVSELERNIVVTAGAGTGKTTLLVNRMLHLLLGHKKFQTEESPIRRVVAMTFTEKAASDMKIRLMEELENIVAAINENVPEEEKKKVEEFLSHLRDTYQTTYSEIERRARKSLEDLDKSLIGTIHSFAAHILRLYPIESGVAPGFVVDEGDVFDELFDKEWTRWLDEELALASPRADVWKGILRRLDLESVRELAKRLSGFTLPLDFLSVEAQNEPKTCTTIIDPLLYKILKITPCCEKTSNNLLLQLNELSKIFNAIKKQGICYLNNSEYDLDKNPSTAKTGWTDEGFLAAQALVKECHTLLKKLKTVDDAFVTATIDHILPFARTFRQKYLSEGYISFDGILTLTRDLLQNKKYRYIRDKLKNEFRTLLVDEFQDTDPVQYEIVLFLSESVEHYDKEARRVILEPGKLFIVGDPKQSIYAFRRADIEAYEQVVKQVCGQDEPLKLQENFRSHSGIIEVINQLFDGRIMVEQPGLQPCYIPIHANRPKKHHSQRVEIVLVSDREGEELKAVEAREAEAEWIAQWITKHVNTEAIEGDPQKNGPHKLKYKDVALLLRAFTQVRPYIDALKRYGIPYLVEGEKYFYTTQEIVDFINLLRAIENPHDRIALVGILRSPIVGLTDREIYELTMNQLLDYRTAIPDKIDFKDIIKPFYDFLRRMHARAGILPVSQLITEILDNTHIAEITACARHGEQKLANLLKLYQTACDMEQLQGISLKAFIDRIKMRIKEAREEGESPLSDETLDVVKILTIHKSKGLEFPVVILGNLHGEVRNDNEALGSAVFDWTTSTTGVLIGKGNQQMRNLQSIIIEKKLNDRSWEEEKRVLYVAMTRAKERLILMGSVKNNNKSYMGLISQSLRDAAGIQLGNETFISDGSQRNMKNSHEPNSSNESRKKFSLGNTEVFVEHFRFDGIQRPLKTPKGEKWDMDWTTFIEIWKRREDAMAEAARTSLFVSPSAMSDEEAVTQSISLIPGGIEEVSDAHPNRAVVIGSLCHRVLESWDFHGAMENLHGSIESAMKWVLPVERFQDVELIKAEALKILSGFIDSEAYKELQEAQILGREVSILLAWNGQIMRGIVDIIYKTDNHIIIADYKTDHVKITDLPVSAEKYHRQKEIYTEAVKRCLKIDNPEFKLLFLRIGKAVSV